MRLIRIRNPADGVSSGRGSGSDLAASGNPTFHNVLRKQQRVASRRGSSTAADQAGF